jgi:hypothetical protein
MTISFLKYCFVEALDKKPTLSSHYGETSLVIMCRFISAAYLFSKLRAKKITLKKQQVTS